ncbi:MAG: DUF1552 domain-containing protein [Polyangiales bacterium]
MTLTRRQFATLLGTAALSAPLLPAWLRRVGAQPTSAPVRFLALRTPHGVDRDMWIPRRADGSEPASTDEDLEGLTFAYENAILTPLMPWRSKITILDGLDTQVCKEGTRADRRRFHGHQEQGSLLTGAQPPEDRQGNYDNHPSLDFYLHARLPSPALLTACVEGTGDWKCMSYDDAGRPRRPEADPRALFRQAFPADFMPPTPEPTDPGEPPPPVVDYSNGEARISAYGIAAIERMRGRLDGFERAKLDAHLEAMLRLAPSGMPGRTPARSPLPPAYCTTSGSDVPTRSGNVGNVAGVEEVTRAHATVIAQAFAWAARGSRRFQLLNDYPNYFRPPRGAHAADSGRYGDSSASTRTSCKTIVGASGTNEAGASCRLLRAGFVGARRTSPRCSKSSTRCPIRSIPPGDPSSTTRSCIGTTSSATTGTTTNTRGTRRSSRGGGRTLRLGRYLRLRNVTSDTRIPHNLLLTSIAQAMGLSDVEYFGDRDLASRANYQGPLVPLMV